MVSDLNDKEAFLLHLVARKSSVSQRELAREAGISLGLINVILKKFVRLGYLKVCPINKRKLEYLLTPDGNEEFTRALHRSLINAIRNYRRIEDNLVQLLKQLKHSGYEYFTIHGDGELKSLLLQTLKGNPEATPFTVGQQHGDHPKAVILNISPFHSLKDAKCDVVNLLETIGIGNP